MSRRRRPGWFRSGRHRLRLVFLHSTTQGATSLSPTQINTPQLGNSYCRCWGRIIVVDHRLLKEVHNLPRSAWRTVELDVPSRQYRHPQIFDQKVQLLGHGFRQLFITDLGHEEPTILLTNQTKTPAEKLVTRYARRMLIENSISDAVRFFHMDALSSAVGLKVDFDLALLVLASGLYRLLARRMRGYTDAQARQVFRDLVDLPADVEISEKEVRVEFHRRAHLPIVLASDLCQQAVPIPWWDGKKLRLTTYKGA